MAIVHTRELDARLRKDVRTWDRALRVSFRRYFSAWPRILARPGPVAEPYWFVLPQAILNRRVKGRERSGRFLRDLLYGQSCAILAVKIHDDLFDGQCRDRSLIFAADLLLQAAADAFSHLFPHDSPFWPYYSGAIRRTLNAIVVVDGRQRHGFHSRASVPGMIRDGFAVCNVGTFAACLRARTVPGFARIALCTDELAIVGKLLDDLEDVEEDMLRGRWNFAAYLLVGHASGPPARRMERFARSVLLNGSVDRWYAMLQRHLRRAARHAAASGIPALQEHVAASQKAVAVAEARLHHNRVRLLFGGVRSGGGQRVKKR